MRLTRIRVRNIASLKGEHVVDFREVMNHSPLFAITGETGAGKSTLLNSIGLALYGQIFKRTLIQNDVVTLGEKEGTIELIFEVKGKSYLASWRARVRKQNGEAYAILPSPTRELYLLSGDQFDSPKTISQEKVEEILHLDFDQFTKCVILNQGEFARFLMSSFTERKDILEKLYPGELLENLSRELRSELDYYLNEKNHLDIELKTLQDDGGAQINAEEELKTATRELSLHEKWSDLLEKLGTFFGSLHHYHQKTVENKKRIEATRKDLTSGTTVYNVLLKATEDAAHLRDEARKVSEEKSPRLLELLKTEEALEKENLHQKRTEEELQRLSQEEKKNTEARLLLEKDITSRQTERDLLSKKLTYSYDGLIGHRNDLEQLFDEQNELEKLTEALASEKERLLELEVKGKELAESSNSLKLRLEAIPEDAETILKTLEKKKDDLTRARARAEEIELQKKKLSDNHSLRSKRLDEIKQTLHELEEKRVPILASLKVQELLSAVSLCVLHPETAAKGVCPVCETPFAGEKFQELRNIAQGFNARKLQEDADRLASEVLKLSTEKEFLTQKDAEETSALKDLMQELKNLPEQDASELNSQIEGARKVVWEKTELIPQKKKIDEELSRVRLSWKTLKTSFDQKDAEGLRRKEAIASLSQKLTEFVTFTPDQVPRLRSDLRLSLEITTLLTAINRIQQNLEHSVQRGNELSQRLTEVRSQSGQSELKIKELSSILAAELKGESAASILKALSERMKTTQLNFDLKDSERRKQEDVLRDFQSKLITYDEVSRDNELQFMKARKDISEVAAPELPELTPELAGLRKTMATLTLNLESSDELFVPLRDVLEKEKLTLKSRTNETRSKVAHFKAILETQEKRRDRVQLLELKRADVSKELSRRERLYEILGKDELRTYVLSLVEENLIIVTNEELGRLCQGRYEIVHQTKTNKLAPEFFILDKFRDGGIRKVSTLSGGETFMVSLAMALGLAEMTRGTAEIDTLFIDEGFGTLDQDSLEDVLDMLNQIQNRGLMVGIISHVKTLTDTLPVNLLVQKKRDGNSQITLKVN